MNSTTHKKKIIIWVLVGLMVLCSALVMGAKSLEKAKTLTLRNATDSLMPLVELASESGGCYDKAKAFHLEMLNNYVEHMESRDIPFLLRLPPFSNKNVVKILKSVTKDLENADRTNAREVIEKASESIAKFLTESKPFTGEPISTFEPEVILKEIRDALKESIIESHKKVEVYATDPSVGNSEAACHANRRAIVYLYLARFGYQEIVSQAELKKFRTDINRAIYYNDALQKSDTVKISEEEHSRISRYSDSELRRLRLLQAIIDNDIQQAQVLLQIAVIKTIPDIQFLAVKS